MWRKQLVLGVAVAVGASLALADVDVSKLPPAAKKEIDFAKEIKPLLEKSCLGCHGPKRQKSKYRVDSRDALIKGGSSEEAAVISGNSEKSPIIHYVAGLIEDMEMPPTDDREKYPAFTPEQIGVLRAWIDQGAKWPDGVTLESKE